MPLNPEKFCGHALAIAFLAIIFAPSICQVAGVDLNTDQVEKRPLRPFPDISMNGQSLRKFPRNFERWYQDHFGLRRLMIRGYGLVMFYGLHTSPNNRTIIGRDGWLFFDALRAGDGDSVSDSRGLNPLTPFQLEYWRWMLQDLNDWYAAHGIPFLAAFVPSKELIYTNYLPNHLTRVGPDAPIDQVSAHIEAHGNFPYLDLKPVLLEGMARHRVFKKTDTHWTEYGAYCGYRAIMEKLRETLPMVQPKSELEFDPIEKWQEGGDLAGLIGLKPLIQEKQVLMVPHVPYQADFSTAFEETALVTSRVYDPDLPRAIIMRDSFGIALIPFLAEHFSEATFSWSRHGIENNALEMPAPDAALLILGDRRLREFMYYPNAVKQFAWAGRFERASIVMASWNSTNEFGGLRGLQGTGLTMETGFLVARNKSRGPLIEIPRPLGFDSQLPIVRIDLHMPRDGQVALVWSNARDPGQHRVAARVQRGRHVVYLPLIDPEATSSIILWLGPRIGSYVLHDIEIRGVER